AVPQVGATGVEPRRGRGHVRRRARGHAGRRDSGLGPRAGAAAPAQHGQDDDDGNGAGQEEGKRPGGYAGTAGLFRRGARPHRATLPPAPRGETSRRAGGGTGPLEKGSVRTTEVAAATSPAHVADLTDAG